MTTTSAEPITAGTLVRPSESAGRDEVVYTITLGVLDALADRRVTDEEARSIVKALEFGDDLACTVSTVCGEPDDDEDDEPYDHSAAKEDARNEALEDECAFDDHREDCDGTDCL